MIKTIDISKDSWTEFCKVEKVIFPDVGCDERGNNPMTVEEFMAKRCREMMTDELVSAYLNLEKFGPVGQKAISTEFWRRAG
jgi:hypothetical protein